MEQNTYVVDNLLSVYIRSGRLEDARRVIHALVKKDVIRLNALIGGYARHSHAKHAMEFFHQMHQEGAQPDKITYVSTLNAWTGMTGGLAQHGCGGEALALFRKMNADGVKPDGTLFVAVLFLCSHAGVVDDGRRLFLSMTQDYGIEPTVVHCKCMMDLLGRAGLLEEAKLFITNMPDELDRATWGALLGACRTYGNVELAEERNLLLKSVRNWKGMMPVHMCCFPTSMLQLAGGRRCRLSYSNEFYHEGNWTRDCGEGSFSPLQRWRVFL